MIVYLKIIKGLPLLLNIIKFERWSKTFYNFALSFGKTLKKESMNKRRRNVLHLVLDDLERLRDPMDKKAALKIIQDAQIKVEQCMDEEETALNNRPESFQFSAGNDSLSENISDLSEANDELEILIDQCQGMDMFDYELIRNDIISIVNTIKRTIHR